MCAILTSHNEAAVSKEWIIRAVGMDIYPCNMTLSIISSYMIRYCKRKGGK